RARGLGGRALVGDGLLLLARLLRALRLGFGHGANTSQNRGCEGADASGVGLSAGASGMLRLVEPSPSHVPPRPIRRAPIEEWLAIPEERRAELIEGRIVYQAMPGPVHGRTQGRIVGLVSGPYDRRAGGGDAPGGWWISMEVDM